jgi:ABC-2 type transport system ATP-binding protein
MTLALSCKNLTKTYRSFKKQPGVRGTLKTFFKREHINIDAVKSINIKIKEGEFVGLLGPNGAGKTTILKMLTGLIHPSGGEIEALGSYRPWERKPAYLRQLGMVMGQRNQLNPDLPAIDSFKLSQAIYDIPEAVFKNRLDEFLTLFQAQEKSLIPVRKLSLGERMKMELILALLHGPKLLFLDEPTIGLDFNAAKQIRDFLKEANRKHGITIILTSHYTKDIEELCERVIVINNGTSIYDGPLNGLDERIQGEREFTLELREDSPALTDWLRTIDVTEIKQEDKSLTFYATTVRGPSIIKDLLTKFDPHNFVDIRVSERPLEDIFAQLYEAK